MEPLTYNQVAILSCLRGYISKYSYSPSMTEIAENTSLSVSTVKYNLDRLAEMGYLIRTPNHARSLRIAGDAKTPEELVDVLLARAPRLTEVYTREELIAAFGKQVTA